ncbi:hypothetical protein EMIT0194P_170124 [Pseudomonas serbica]
MSKLIALPVKVEGKANPAPNILKIEFYRT